ncbi:hypothetical protein [Flavobacterium sp. FlaQc-30]|uniref:hypothetical protein n=1 Tax=Flavobacterium sp. FlaQc-30 TaxID=3374179 RepID=UPI0037567A16
MTKYNKFRTFCLPKEMVDQLIISSYLSPLEENKIPEVIVGLSVINEIISKSNQIRKLENYPFHCIPMDSKFLKVKFGYDYKLYFHWLLSNNIVWRDTYYSGKTTYYYLNSIKSYIDNSYFLLKENDLKLDDVIYTYCIHKEIEITQLSADIKGIDVIGKDRIYNNWYKIRIPITALNKKFLVRDYENDSIEINNAPKHIKQMGSYYRNNLSIRFDDAIKYAEERYLYELSEAKTQEEEYTSFKRYSSRISSINAINNGKQNKTLRFKRNGTNKRLDTNLTNMASDLRPFIMGYENMSYLDLNNSQPVLFNILLNKYKNDASQSLLHEIDSYFNFTTSGKWYEKLMELYSLSRNDCKKIWMEIAYSKNQHFKEHKNIFKKEFPSIYAIIENVKKVNYSAFAIELQSIESKIFIDEISRELVNNQIIPFTMHDGLLVKKEMETKCLEIMERVLKKHLGVVPVISIG